jgi:predicted TIM-barrel fold metal-dependent hydrolase
LNIDFHNHFYPRAYLEELGRGGGYAKVGRDAQGRLLIHYEGDYNVIVGPHIDLAARLEDMNRCGIDMQVLTLTTPSVERETPKRGIKLAELANDGFGEIVNKYSDRFLALAALPLQEPEAAAIELERGVRECGLRGGTLMSNVGGRPLDSEEFMPVYEMAVKLDVPLFIHPTSPINSKAMTEYRLVPILGFGVDTTLLVLRLVFGGVLKWLPGLKLVASHLGGVFPYLRGRIETGFNAYPECKARISESPSTYLKRIWMDSIIYDQDVLMSAIAFSGAEKIVLGSDHPHQIGDIANAVERIKKLDISEGDKEKMLGGNAAELLKL